MNQGLFESLTGFYLDGSKVDEVPMTERQRKSIMDHLNRLLNTREGSVPHLPNYGIPDVSEIYRKMPGSIIDLQNAIKKTIELYEPRLKNVKVLIPDEKKNKFSLSFIITGEMRNSGGQVRFETTFASNGKSSTAPWRKQLTE